MLHMNVKLEYRTLSSRVKSKHSCSVHFGHH